MTQPPLFLDTRTIISVSGPDAEAFLNGIVTVSTLAIAEGEFRYGALLTPQGKIIADMFLTRGGEAILLDCASVAAAALAKRLTLMKLRAAVVIRDLPELGVIVFEGAADPRSEQAPKRRIASRATTTDAATYHDDRIAAGLAEQGVDFGVEDVFPADINMDLIQGVDFRKGCFVGQEVVSRMKRRGTARRRTLKTTSPAGISPGPVLAGGFEIGAVTSVSSGACLARVRIDRMAEAQAAGQTFTVQGQDISFDQPSWLAGELAALAEARDAKV